MNSWLSGHFNYKGGLHNEKINLLLLLVIMAGGLILVGFDWLSPMISIEKDTRTVSLWGGEFSLHRNQTMEYVFRDGDDFNDIAIMADALIAGGAVPAALRVAYGGDGQHLVRLVAFAYNFFDHGQPVRLNAHTANPNPQEILVLWRNPENGHWFNMIQNGVGREAVTLGQNHNELVSLRNDNPVYTFLLNHETAEKLTELEVFIIATAAPTRVDDYERSGCSIIFALELPDLDNHFHGWEILAACNGANLRSDTYSGGADNIVVAENSPRDTILVVDRFPFLYLTVDYGLNFFSAFDGCFAATEISFGRQAELANAVDSLGLDVIMIIGNTSVAQSVASASARDVEIVSLQDFQTVSTYHIRQGLTYLGGMRQNLEALRTALQ